MLVLGGLVRLVSLLLLIVLALVGLAVVVLALDPAGGAKLLQLPQLRDVVGPWLDGLEAGSATDVVSVLSGVGAVLLGLALLAGLLIPRRERLVFLTRGGPGTLTARRRALAHVATALAEQARGVTEAKVRVRARRRSGGRLRVRANRTKPADARDVERGVSAQLEDLTQPFKLKASVHTRPPGRGARVQ
jgi:hypothetical protein